MTSNKTVVTRRTYKLLQILCIHFLLICGCILLPSYWFVQNGRASSIDRESTFLLFIIGYLSLFLLGYCFRFIKKNFLYHTIAIIIMIAFYPVLESIITAYIR